MNIPVLYEDQWLLALDKPAGLLVIPAPVAGARQKRTLTGILNEDASAKAVAYRLHPCHRLDRETSGVILYAKGKAPQKTMMEAFRQRKVRKTYIAFIHGVLSVKSGRITAPIEGRPARTDYKVLEERPGFSVLEVEPVTGRTNQIRIHFKSIGHPLAGETKFAFRKDYALKAKRLCLHARSLAFVHPVTSAAIKIESTLPADLENFLKKHP